MFNQPWKKTTLKRLILSLICILLPIYILSMIIYKWGIDTLQDQISKSMISQVSLYFDGLEREVMRIQTLLNDMLSDENLNRLAVIPESLSNIEKMENILRLQQRLSAIQSSSPYIKDVYAFIPASDKNISTLTVSDFEQQEFDDLRHIPLSHDSQVTNMNGRLFLSAAYPWSNPNSKRARFHR